MTTRYDEPRLRPSPTPPVGTSRASRPPRALPPRLTIARRLRRIGWFTLVACLPVILISWASAMSASVNTPMTINTIEWLRSNGGAGIASWLEQVYYSANAPSKGGAELKQLQMKIHHQSIQHPVDVTPVISPALPGEGRWQPSGTWMPMSSPVQVTQYRPQPDYPQIVAGLAWIDPRRSVIRMYAGNLEPNVPMPNRGPEQVPTKLRSRLLATFNSGFKLEDDHSGWVDNGTTYAPLARGQATFIGYTNGTYNIINWTGGAHAPSSVSFARQNLPLIVDNGRANPNLSDGPAWGATLGNAIQVWRSGIGITANGNLIYAAADWQTVGSLAQILIHAGAVRAMELDINDWWTTFNYYGGPGGAGPSKLLASMVRPASRYLSPDDRDFFAVYLK